MLDRRDIEQAKAQNLYAVRHFYRQTGPAQRIKKSWQRKDI